MSKKINLLFLFSILMTVSTYGQKFWQESNIDRVSKDKIIEYSATVTKADYFSLNVNEVREFLKNAPLKSEVQSSDVNMNIPLGNDKMMNFEIFKTNTISGDLAEKYSNINSFVGKSKSGENLRITLTKQGFYGSIYSPESGKTTYINPISKDANIHYVFDRNNTKNESFFECQVETEVQQQTNSVSNDENETFTIDDSTLRTYRLALSSTGEYSEFHIDQAGEQNGSVADQKAAVLAAMVVTIDRVNEIYERDLAVTLEIIEDNDDLIFLNENTDPFTNQNGGIMLSENQNTVDNIIGSPNYDIGHVFSTGGGGIASLGSVCNPNQKAAGVTGSPNPVGDPFDIDFVAHEMGHQFGANHSFNNACGGARNGATAYEPGSGSTIMAYAGICPPNVQNNSDATFHYTSIQEIANNIDGNGGICAEETTISNTAPSITSLQDYTIPNGTAFKLEADATDNESDILTYTWDQLDNQTFNPQPPESDSPSGPNYKSTLPSSNSMRYFPNISSVLNGNLTPTWEVTPDVSRVLNFGLTVRDNNSVGGQVSTETMQVNVSNSGPFQVTSQSEEGLNFEQGETITVEWDVAGTDSGNINTSNVNILLSTDSGETFETVLASNTANDGTEEVTLPSDQVAFGRIMVEAVDNVFYAVNDEFFAIDTEVTTECTTFESTDTPVSIPDGNGTQQFNPGQPGLSVVNVSENITFDDITLNIEVNHTYVGDLLVLVQHPDETQVALWELNCGNSSNFNLSFNDSFPGITQNDCQDNLTGTFSSSDFTGNNLTDLEGVNTQGQWIVAVFDGFSGDTGTIESASIEFCETLSSDSFEEENRFSISPNPSVNGRFDVNMTNQIQDDAKLNIYDLRGRLIQENDFDNSAGNTYSFELNNASSGVYLVEVINGDQKTVEKLIVE
ncbi:MAG: reprolysin-like metallopeptidase [Psychroflexus sp.]